MRRLGIVAVGLALVVEVGLLPSGALASPGTTERVSVDSAGNEGNDAGSFYAAISADGRYVAFESYASNLVPGDTNLWGDVFVRDRIGAPVGGIAELPPLASAPGGSGWTGGTYAVLGMVGGALAITVVGVAAKRRRDQQ
jgi:hypothetical protein